LIVARPRRSTLSLDHVADEHRIVGCARNFGDPWIVLQTGFNTAISNDGWRPSIQESQMKPENFELPDDLMQSLQSAAQQFDSTPRELVARAVEHYLNHIAELEATRSGDRTTSANWAAAKITFQSSKCMFDPCPYAGECPVEVCPL
jgi:hypothetical protein